MKLIEKLREQNKKLESHIALGKDELD